MNPVTGKDKCNLNTINSTETDGKSNDCRSDNAGPSYISLACRISGYSNLTNYDSQFRQDINKSRELKPKCYDTEFSKSKSEKPLQRYLESTIAMENLAVDKQESAKNVGGIHSIDGRNYYSSNIECESGSFIQNRVEQLYGPGALAESFFRTRRPTSNLSSLNLSSECTIGIFDSDRKKNSLQKCEHECQKKMVNLDFIEESTQNGNSEVKVPLTVSFQQKQNFDCKSNRINTDMDTKHNKNEASKTYDSKSSKPLPLNDNKLPSGDINNKECFEYKEEITKRKSNRPKKDSITETSFEDKDGYYFLNLCKHEQSELLKKSNDIENDIIGLTDNSDISDDTLGMLRSASGKARLLVSQKMNQFEGLCQRNLESSNDKFSITADDLHGFWDMIYLQIRQLHRLFREIDELKKCNWKKIDSNIIVSRKTDSTKTCNDSKTTSSKIKNEAEETDLISDRFPKREAQRKQLLDLKRRNRIALISESKQSGSSNNNGEAIKIFYRNEIANS